jgi:hypothetical protein
MANTVGGTGGTVPQAPPHFLTAGKGVVVNPSWTTWNNQYGSIAGPHPSGYSSNPTTTGSSSTPSSSKPAASKSPTTTSTGGYFVDPNTGDVYNNGTLIGGPDFHPAGSGLPNTAGSSVYGGSSVGAMTQYEAAQVVLDKQKLADAEAQQKADQSYREAQAIDTFNKNWQDYQKTNYYGSFYGPSAAAPAGSPNAFRLPEPTYVQDYYKNNPQAGQDPWSAPIAFGGYTGGGFLNPQQPGVQNAPPTGSVAAPIAGQTGYNPFSGPTSGQGVNPAQFSGAPAQPPQASTPGASQAGPVDPNTLGMIASHPAANQFVMSLPGAQQFVNQATNGQGLPGVSSPQQAPGGTTPPQGQTAIPSMATGGIVPGAPGQPQLIEAHGGEQIIPTSQTGGQTAGQTGPPPSSNWTIPGGSSPSNWTIPDTGAKPPGFTMMPSNGANPPGASQGVTIPTPIAGSGPNPWSTGKRLM